MGCFVGQYLKNRDYFIFELVLWCSKALMVLASSCSLTASCWLMPQGLCLCCVLPSWWEKWYSAVVPTNALPRKVENLEECSSRLRGHAGSRLRCVAFRRVKKALSKVNCHFFSSDLETTWHPPAPVCLDTVLFLGLP